MAKNNKSELTKRGDASTKNVSAKADVAKNTKAKGPRKTTQKKYVGFCPGCGAEILPTAKFCSGCGKPILNFCPDCGSPIPIGAKFCGNCGCGTRGCSDKPIATIGTADGVNMSCGTIAANGVDIGAMGNGRATGCESIPDSIRRFIKDTYNNTTGVMVGERLTPEFLATAELKLEEGETPILALKTWPDIEDKLNSFLDDKGFKKISAFIKKGKPGTIMITDRRFVYIRLRPDDIFSSLRLAGTGNGSIPIDEIWEARVGNHDRCLGTNYVGHQLILNGKVVGLVRMGGGILYDEETIEYMNSLFSECFNNRKR